MTNEGKPNNEFRLPPAGGPALASGIMDWLTDLLAPGGHLFGIDWNTWKIVGWSGNVIFFSRFIVQWFATERRKQVVVPTAFWWLSILGTLILLSYSAFYRKDSVFIFAYAFSWIPYVRNLIIHSRHLEAHTSCAGCGHECPPHAKFCQECGTRLGATEATSAAG